MPGIHHVTGITARVQANVDFYAGLLGLRLVKRTVNHEDASALHLFYGDGAASPGTLISFFAWPGGSAGRRGHGQATELGLIVPRASIGYWTSRLIEHGVPFDGPTVDGTTTRLALSDPDGLAITLTGRPDAPEGVEWQGSGVPGTHQVRGISHVTLWTERPAETGAVLEEILGFERSEENEATTSYRVKATLGNTVNVRDTSGFWSGGDGAGSLHHVAFRAAGVNDLTTVVELALQRGLPLSELKEHGYFQSRYFREPGGSLIEVATDGPGMALDEAPSELGTRLVLPPDLELMRGDVEAVMPYFALPDEPRRPERDLGWIHSFVPGTSGLTLLVLHGSGGSETQLLPLARRVAESANLLAPRGRSTAEQALRYFARRPDGTFDQEELDHEADALTKFVGDAAALYGFDPQRVVILGYSNGAHVGTAALARHPTSFAGAALLRSVAPFGLPGHSALSGKPVLMLQGEGDHLLRDQADEKLAAYLQANGASLQSTTVPGGHYLSAADESVLRPWLEGLGG